MRGSSPERAQWQAETATSTGSYLVNARSYVAEPVLT